MSTPTTSTLWLTLLLLPHLISSTCYSPNSTQTSYTIIPDDTACFPNQENSRCCGTGWSCLSDGVCYIQQGTQDFYYRGSCTDRTWQSQECPGWCLAQDNSTSIPLVKCQKSNGEDWYCCPGDQDCSCDSGKDAVKLGAAQPSTVTVIGSTSWPGFVATRTSSVTGTVAAASASVSASASATGTSSPGKSGSNTAALAAGLGAGIGGALVLGLVAGWLFVRSRRRRGTAKVASPPYTATPDEHYMPSSQPLMGKSVVVPGDGCYATKVVDEKDGRGVVPVQELDGQKHGDGFGRVEMEGRTVRGEERGEGVGGRFELA